MWVVPPSAGAQSDLGPTTVILVRHAEKSRPLGDFPLSREGWARARELARVLGETKVDAIYATQYMRTQQTAKPLADLKGVPVWNLQTTEHYVTELLDRIRVDHPGQTILVVTHRQTLGPLIEGLGAPPVPEVTEEQYDRLYVVTISSGGTTLMSLRYGRATP
jgi:broad specificity phosphatase PhoE